MKSLSGMMKMLMPSLLLASALGFLPAAGAGEGRVLYLDFERDAVAVTDKGPVAPLVVDRARQHRCGIRCDPKAIVRDGVLSYAAGLLGKRALWLGPAEGKAKALDAIWPIDGVLKSEGSVSFWVKLPKQKDGKAAGLRLDHVSNHLVFCGADGGELLRIGEHNSTFWADFRGLGGKRALTRFTRNVWHCESWYHVVVTWHREGKVRLILNGLPYFPDNTWERDEMTIPNMDFSKVKYLHIGGWGEQIVDEVEVFSRALSAQEAYARYRAIVPLDIVLPRGVLAAGRDTAAEVVFTPGGRYTRPIPGNAGETPAQLTVTTDVIAPDGKVLASETDHLNLTGDEIRKSIPLGKLEPGTYAVRFRWPVSGGGQMSDVRSLVVLPPPPPSAPATAAEVEKGDLLFEKTFDNPSDPEILTEGSLKRVGNYLELGDRKGERFSSIVTFGPKVRQKPCIVEIEWPDDKPRMCGFYLYMEKAKGECYRDRLQGGVQAGLEYPNSGRMVTTRYVFWPQCDTYSFELRTMANGYPAAVKAICAWVAKDARLPKLAVRTPDGLEPRRLGTCDEDQTLNTTLATPKELGPETDRLLDYLDYTGMNTHHAQVLRYGFSYFPFPGSYGAGMYPYLPGAYPFVVDALAARGKAIVPIVNVFTLQELRVKDVAVTRAGERGLVALDKDRYSVGPTVGSNSQANPANPECVAMLCRHVEDFAASFAKCPNVEGFSFWRFLIWDSDDKGYDDWTVNRFSAETGVKIPDADRRYEFLTEGPAAAKWHAWRADKTFALVKALRATLDRHNPSWKMFLSDVSWKSRVLEDLAVRIRTELPNTFVTVYRRPMKYRHEIHWNGNVSDFDFVQYDAKSVRDQSLRRSNELYTDFYTYFETFVKSQRKTHGCYFQSMDVKPHSRFFLREFAFLVGAADAQEIAAGGQPFVSWGAEREFREFARAYTALPRLAFEDVKVPTDSVVVRRRMTKNGTYFYLVNQTWDTATVELKLAGSFLGFGPRAEDLSTGVKSGSGDYALKPYELRSFLIPGNDVELSVGEVRTPSLAAFYAKRRTEVEEAIGTLDANGVPVAEERKMLADYVAAALRGNFAEAHRLAFSPTLGQVEAKVRDIKTEIECAGLLRRNVFRVNCGGGYARSAGGDLFFPDIAYSPARRYGFVGGHKAVTRNVTGLKATPHAELFKTEAYDCDGWRVDVPDGKYTLILHLKIGYKDDAKPETVCFSILANGQTLFSDRDLFAAQGGDFMKPLRYNYPVEVMGGRLELVLQQKRGFGSNIRLLNGFELLPSK